MKTTYYAIHFIKEIKIFTFTKVLCKKRYPNLSDFRRSKHLGSSKLPCSIFQYIQEDICKCRSCRYRKSLSPKKLRKNKTLTVKTNILSL